MGACGCGGQCGPIIVRPEIDLGDVTVDTGPDRELVVLCDATGAPFLRRYSIDTDGNVAVSDWQLDGLTPATPTEPVGTCGPDADPSPGELDPLRCSGFTLWDDGYAFRRTVCYDQAGAVVSVTDTELDGTTGYTVAGTVTACCPEADPSPGEPPPAGEVFAFCDATGEVFLRTYILDAAATISGHTDTDLDGAPYNPVPPIGACRDEDTSPAEPCDTTTPVATVGLCLADGTPIAVTAERGCDGTVTATGWLNLTTGAWAAGAPPAGAAACTGEAAGFTLVGVVCDIDPGTGDLLALVVLQYERDDAGQIVGVQLVDAATGDPYTLQGTLTVCPAGEQAPEQDLVVLCDDDGAGTITRFLRDFRRDENGTIVGFSDYTPDGAAYTPTGTVAVCTEDCGDTETVVLCHVDLGTGDTEPFLRRYSIACDGTVTVTDTELDGITPFATVGEVTLCPAGADVQRVELCDDTTGDGTPDTRFVRLYRIDPTGAVLPSPIGDFTPDLSAPYTPVAEMECGDCGLPDDAVTSGATNSGQPGELSATDTTVPQPYGPPNFTPEAHIPLPGGGAALWSGGSLVFPAEPDGSAGDGSQVYRAVAAVLQVPRLPCDDGTAQVSVSVDVTNDGPTDGRYHTAGLWLYTAGAEAASRLERNIPTGETRTMTLSATVPAADLASGRVMVLLEAETFHHGPKQETASGFVATYAYDVDSCGEPAEALAVRICGPVTIGGGMLTGAAGRETVVASGPQLLERRKCDDVNGDGTEIVAYVELWSVWPETDSPPPQMIGTFDADDLSQPYEPVNPGPCPQAECGLTDDDPTAGETNSGQPGELSATDTAVPQPYGPAKFTPEAHIPLPGGGAALWSGGQLTFPAEPDGSAGDGSQVYRAVAAVLQVPRPPCDDGTVTMSVQVDMTNNGPSDGRAHSGGLWLYSAGGEVGYVAMRNVTAGTTETPTIADVTISAADLAAGRVMVVLEAETFHSGPKSWTAENFLASYEFGTAGCTEGSHPVQHVKICGPVTIGGGMLAAGGSSGGTGGTGGAGSTPTESTCVIKTGGGRVNGNPNPVNLDLTDTVPGLQSVTVTTLDGQPVNVTTDNGIVPIPAGVSLTWSVQRDQDDRLSTIVLDIPANTDMLLNFTCCEGDDE